jgi:hypothetical protein
MDLLKLLRSLEDLVVEIALWIILLPRTLFSVIVNPVKLARYFDRIQDTDAKERDDEYLSPVLFWLIFGPVSLIICFTQLDQRALALYGASAGERVLTASLMLLGPPLGFALASVLLRHEPVSRRSLGRQFALQCYFHAPIAFLLVVYGALATRFGEDVGGAIGTGIMVVGLVWFVIAEFRVARRESEVGRAVSAVALGCSFGCLLFFLVGFAIMFALFLSGRMLLD